MFSPPRVKPVRQAESHECILACLAMVARFHGKAIRLRDLRQAHPTLQRGGRLRDLIEIARSINLGTRAIKVDVPDLGKIVLPCIIHWNFNHFIVLERVQKNRFHVVDPASGRHILDKATISKHFTGIALELVPLPSFYTTKVGNNTPSTGFDILPIAAFIKPILQFIFLSTIVLVFTLVSPLAVQIVVDEVIVKDDHDLLLIVAAVFLGANLIGALATYLQGFHILRQSSLTRITLTHQFLDRLMIHNWGHFARRNLGNFVAQYNSLTYLVNFVVRNVGTIFTDLLFVLVLTLILFMIEPSIAWIVLALNLIVVGIRAALLRHVRTLQNNDVIQRSEEEAYFVETMRGISSVKANSLEITRNAGNIDKTVRSVNASFSLANFGLRYQFFIQSLKAFETIVALYLLAGLVMDGRMTIGVMYAFYSYRQFLEQRLTGFVEAMGELLNIKVHKDRLAETFTSDDGLAQSANIGQFLKFEGKVELRNIVYRIDNQSKTIFEGFSGKVDKGGFLHISGPTGSGKTTLLKIMLQSIAPDSGVVLIDDIPVRQGNLSVLRNSVGVVLQEDTLFRGSISENVSLFDETPDYSRLQECCKTACVHDEIIELPLGYQSEVGDLGANLSTGQQQRLLLARAFYNNPSILILDEATANLNLEMEEKVISNIKSLHRTVIFASHSTVIREHADIVWELPLLAATPVVENHAAKQRNMPA